MFRMSKHGAGLPLLIKCPKVGYEWVEFCPCCNKRVECLPTNKCVKSKFTNHAYHGVCGQCDSETYPRV